MFPAVRIAASVHHGDNDNMLWLHTVEHAKRKPMSQSAACIAMQNRKHGWSLRNLTERGANFIKKLVAQA